MVYSEDLRQKKQIAGRVQVYLFGTLALLIAGFLAYDYFNIREQRLAQSELLFAVLAPASLQALEENNPALAGAALKKLSRTHTVRAAVLYNEAGTVVARYVAASSAVVLPPRSPSPGNRFDGHRLESSHPLSQGPRTLGTLYLQLSFEDQQDSWRALSFLLLMFLLLALWAQKSLLSALRVPPENMPAHPVTIGDSAGSGGPLAGPEPEESPSDQGHALSRSPDLASEDATQMWVEHTQTRERLNFEIKKRQRAEDILKTHNRILEHLTLGHPLNEVLDQIAENLERQIGADVHGAIYLLDESQTGLDLVSAPGLPDDYKEQIQAFELSRDECPFGASATHNRVVIVENFDTDHTWETFRDTALKNGFRACWAVPVADPTGEVIGVIGVVCTSRRSPSVEELRHINASGFLAGMAIARNRFEEDMKIRAEELARSNRDLEEFASIASHDLQEPLRKIISFGEQFDKYYAGSLDQRGNDYLAKILKSATKMQRFITDLLAYSRAGARPGPMEPTDLNQVVREVMQDFEYSIEKNGAVVKVGALPVILADAVLIRQVVSNLLGNALKFSHPDTPPQIEIESEAVNESQVQVTFRDDGIGFNEAYRERIFKPFERLHPSSQFEGTGMGLALCKKIVERHGGTISAESFPGKGTLITLILPRG